MEITPDNFSNLARAIQLSLAPAFLLTAIAGLLNVMAGRLSRIIDRGRALAEDHSGTLLPEHDSVNLELKMLERRRRYTSVAITASTIAALLVCMVIAMLFIEGMLNAPLNKAIGVMFTAAMLSLIAGLAYFIFEVHLATRSVRIYSRETE